MKETNIMYSHKGILNILLIDDDEVDRLIIKEVLRKAPLKTTIREAIYAQEGMDILEKENIDCILLDYHLPDFSGIKFLEVLQSQGVKDIPIIFITGEEREELGLCAITKGAEDYIPKNMLNNSLLLSRAIEYAITRRRAFCELEKSHTVFSAFMKNTGEFMFILTGEFTFEFTSDSMIHHLGYTAQKLNSSLFFDLFKPGTYCSDDIVLGCLDSKVYSFEGQWLTSTGEIVLGEITLTSIVNKGKIETIYGIFHDISRHKELERALREEKRRVEVSYEKLHNANKKLKEEVNKRKKAQKIAAELARHDTLTGLPNRLKFNEMVEEVKRRAYRAKTPVAFMVLDLDKFKFVNDTFGHEIGDQLLVEVTSRLKDCIRDVDILARVGGDEFHLIIENFTTEKNLAHIADRMITRLGQSFYLEGYCVNIGCSIGISIYPHDGKDILELIKKADLAMYNVKHNGKNNFQFFTEQLDNSIQEKMKIERDLSKALAQGELELFYQPQINLKTGIVCGIETLLRWRHPELGLILPDIFIPQLEENGEIQNVSEWLFVEACQYFKELKGQWDTLEYIAINCSLSQLSDEKFSFMVKNCIRETAVNPQCIHLEISEKVLISDESIVLRNLHELKDFGIGVITLDNFGKSMLPFNSLKKYPIDRVKVNSKYFNDYHDQSKVLSAVVLLSQILDLQDTVISGVEISSELEKIKQSGCNTGQGYLFSPPVAKDELPNLLSQTFDCN